MRAYCPEDAMVRNAIPRSIAKRRMEIEERIIVARDLEISAYDVLPTRLACSALDILRTAKKDTLFDAASYV
jgi:hypothetical protein